MRHADESTPLKVQIDTHHCELSPAEVAQIQDGLEALGRQVEHFPISDVHVLIEYNGRSNDYSVKTTLILPGSTLVANDHDPVAHAAFQRGLQGLEENVRAYKDRMGQVEERQKQEKGTHQDLQPTVDPDPAALDTAVAGGDYTAFRAAAFGYEEPLRLRVGRWVERYPEVEARIGAGLEVEDVVEAVFLDAFEGYESRPLDVRFGDWLEGLIDPAVKALQSDKDGALENVRLARSAREAEQGPAAV